MAENLVITNIQALDTFCTLNLGVLRTNKATISSDLDLADEILSEFGISINFKAPVSFQFFSKNVTI